jgi:hypothetical protein
MMNNRVSRLLLVWAIVFWTNVIFAASVPDDNTSQSQKINFLINQLKEENSVTTNSKQLVTIGKPAVPRIIKALREVEDKKSFAEILGKTIKVWLFFKISI